MFKSRIKAWRFQKYMTRDDWLALIHLDDDLRATGQSEFAPKAKSPTVFEFPPAHIEVEFDSAASFTLKQGGMNLKFKKAVTQ